MHKFIFILLITTLNANNLNAKNNLLLTGKIEAGVTQSFTVPWSQTWNQQIKWLKPEGELVKKDDLVILFDTSGLDSQIEQQKSFLRQSKEKAKNSQLKLEQDIINAEHTLIKTQLEYKLTKASIDIPKNYRSDFEEDNLSFEFKKSVNNLEQSKLKLSSTQKSLQADISQQAIEVKRIQEELNKQQFEIKALQLYADRSGAVLHASHPWNGSKIAEGQTVQTSWKIASIPGSGSEYIQSWVNEVDWPHIQISQKATLTLDAYPNEHFTGKVTKIGQQAESKDEWGSSTYYELEIQIVTKSTNPLIPGMSVRIELL